MSSSDGMVPVKAFLSASRKVCEIERIDFVRTIVHPDTTTLEKTPGKTYAAATY